MAVFSSLSIMVQEKQQQVEKVLLVRFSLIP